MAFKLPYIQIFCDKDSNYKEVVISWKFDGKGEEKKIFSTGDVCKDYADCSDFAWENFGKHEIPIMLSSSVDHFCFDHEDYGWAIVNNREVIVKLEIENV